MNREIEEIDRGKAALPPSGVRDSKQDRVVFDSSAGESPAPTVATIGSTEVGGSPHLVINEIAVSAALDVPPLGDGGRNEGSPVAVPGTATRYSFVELYNNSDSQTETFANSLEFLNPQDDVVVLDLPDEIAVPAGGHLLLYQDATADTGGDATVIARIFDASGSSTDGFIIADAVAWGLGEDTTAPLAVNLVSGDTESLDSFAANLDTADLSVLTAAAWNADNLAPGNLDLGFQTFNGELTRDHKVFSRVFDENDTGSGAPLDSDSATDWTTSVTPTDGRLNALAGSGVLDPNPADPERDDLNPAQPNPDPTSGQTVLAASGGAGALLEGGAGPDFLFGADGDDTLYGGSQALVAAQAEAAGDSGTDTAFADHNDFLSGDAGDDALYGGAGGDYLIGGVGRDTQDGGTGDDWIFGYAAPIGGVDESFDPGDSGFSQADSIAGDILDEGSLDYGPSPSGAAARIEQGGDDTIHGGLGDDLIAGEALAVAENFAGAEAVNLDRADPEASAGNDLIYGSDGDDTVAGEALARDEAPSAGATAENAATQGGIVGSDTIEGGDGSDVIAGDAMARTRSDGFGAFGEVRNLSTGGTAGSDRLEGGSGSNRMSGDALVRDASRGGGTVIVANQAEGPGAFAGDDTLIASDGDDSLVGDGFGSVATPSVTNSATAGASAGNDLLLAGDGANKVAGEAYAIFFDIRFAGPTLGTNRADDGAAGNDTIVTGSGNDVIAGESFRLADSEAKGVAGAAGNDSISGGGGNDVVAGDSLAEIDRQGFTEAVSKATEGGVAAADWISGESGADTLAGDALARATGSFVEAQSSNHAGGGSAGNDTVLGGSGGDLMSGDALAFSGGETATALAENSANDVSSSAGNDSASGGSGQDRIAGDSLARGGFQASAMATTIATAGGIAAADIIRGGAGADFLAGDALAHASEGSADAVVEHRAEGGPTGGDTITAGTGNDLVSGDGLALATGHAAVVVENMASAAGSAAGGDSLRGLDRDDSLAGDALAVGDLSARVEVTNVTYGDDGVLAEAGNDTITGDGAADVLAGEAMAKAIAGSAEAVIVNAVFGDATPGNAGNDEIDGGGDYNRIAGDALADGDSGSLAQAQNSVTAHGYAGSDTIVSGNGRDTLAGDALAVGGGTAQAANAASIGVLDGASVARSGDDTLESGGWHDLVSGDAFALGNNAVAEADNAASTAAFLFEGGESAVLSTAGNDSIMGAAGRDLLAGDAVTLADSGGRATANNDVSATASVMGPGPDERGELFTFTRAGDDTILGGEDKDRISGDAVAVGVAAAATANNSVSAGALFSEFGSFQLTAESGGDLIGSDGTDSGDDIIGGDALATSAQGTAQANNLSTANSPIEGFHTATGSVTARAGSDAIDGVGGRNILAGDAVTSAKAGGDATADNSANSDGPAVFAGAGDDTIESGSTGGAANIVAGDALTMGKATTATATANAVAGGLSVAQAGSDFIRLSSTSHDTLAGDALVSNVDSRAQTSNTATASGMDGSGFAGRDTIDLTAAAHSSVSGDSLADGADGEAVVENVATSSVGGVSSAGEDLVMSGDADDTVAGDALAIGDRAVSLVDNAASTEASATDGGEGFARSSAGSDSIDAGSGGDLLAGDALTIGDGGAARVNNDASTTALVTGSGPDFNQQAELVATASAGSDTLRGGDGKDTIAGDALVTGSGAAAVADNETSVTHLPSEFGRFEIVAEGGSDVIYGDRTEEEDHGDDDVIAGDALATGLQGAAETSNVAAAVAAKFEEGTAFGPILALSGNDTIDAGIGDNIVAGDTATSHEFGGDAITSNWARSTESGGVGRAGDDRIQVRSLSGEGANTISGDALSMGERGMARANNTAEARDGDVLATASQDFIDVFGSSFDKIAGDALAYGALAEAETRNFGLASGESDFGPAYALAGSDGIEAGSTLFAMIAGDSLAFGEGGAASVQNTAVSELGGYAPIGDDVITGGRADDTISGDALSAGDNGRATATNQATGFDTSVALAGNDVVFSNEIWADEGSDLRNDGDDVLAGDALALGEGASANVANTATANDTSLVRAGKDTILGNFGSDLIAGDAMASGLQGGDAAVENLAFADEQGRSMAGSDEIYAGDFRFVTSGFYGNDSVAGDALTASDQTSALTENRSTVFDGNGLARTGDDSIYSGDGVLTIAGDSLSLGAGAAAQVENMVSGAGASAGNDLVRLGDNAESGEDGLLIVPSSLGAGDALATGDDAEALVANRAGPALDAAAGASRAGNDTIIGGNGGYSIAGDALASGRNGAAVVVNSAAVLALLGNDVITVSGIGDDLISGDAMATDGGDASLSNDVTESLSGSSAGSDSITADAGDDTVAGDALSIGGLATADFGGDDTVSGGSGNDLISGDSLALGGGVAESRAGGDDLLYGGSGSDTVYGDSNGDDSLGGDDSLFGDAGADYLLGNGGNDRLFGGTGDDTLDGGDGNDTLEGGPGSDIFAFTAGLAGSTDVVSDFSVADGDVLDVSDLLVGLGAEDGASLASYLEISFDDAMGHSALGVDVDGDASGFIDLTIVLEGVDLVGGVVDQEEILQSLIDSGSLNAL